MSKPTIEELEKILNSEPSIKISPNGEITTIDIEKLQDENQTLKESMNELLKASKEMRLNLKCVADPSWDDAIQKAESLK